MRGLRAAVRRDDLRARIAAVPVFGETPPEPVLIACPRCGDQFFADLAPYDAPFTLEADEWAALVRLEGECPHHAHRFEVAA